MQPRSNRRPATWPAYAAAVWSFVFAAMSFYWALGGTIGIDTLAESIKEKASTEDQGFLALTWATGVLKVAGGFVALALVHPWGRRIPRKLLLFAAWGGGIFIILYEGASFIEAALIEVGLLDVPESMGATAVRWSLYFWRPWWLLGGFLFILAARDYQKTHPVKRSD